MALLGALQSSLNDNVKQGTSILVKNYCKRRWVNVREDVKQAVKDMIVGLICSVDKRVMYVCGCGVCCLWL